MHRFLPYARRIVTSLLPAIVGSPPQSHRKNIRRRAFVSLLVLVGIFVVSEIGTRLAYESVAIYTDYWGEHAAVKFEHYRTLVTTGRTPDVVIVGDSTGSLNLEPGTLATSMPQGTRVYNLATPANFPNAFRHTTLPLLRPPFATPRLVVASFSPGGFCDQEHVHRLEQKILSSRACRRNQGATSLADFLLLPRLQQLRETDARLHSFPEDSCNGHQIGVELPCTKPSAGTLKPNSTEACTLKWSRKPVDPHSILTPTRLTPARLAILQELNQAAQESGFNLVFISPCRFETCVSGMRPAECEELVQSLLQVTLSTPAHILDATNCPGMQRDDFQDSVHLNSLGAERFSAKIAPLIASALAECRHE